MTFGTATYKGSPAAEFKKFEETIGFFFNRAWANKIASDFTVVAFKSGSKVNTLIDLSVFAAQYGMVSLPIELTAR